jgi:aromatic-L-amino-acid decarboxylase
VTDPLLTLEQAAHTLEPDATQRDHLIAAIMAYTNRFLDEISSIPAYSPPTRDHTITKMLISETGTDIETVLALLRDHIDTPGLNPASGRYLGYVPGGGIFHAALGDFLAAISNRYAGMALGSPGAVQLENRLLRWMADEIGYPDTAAGNLSSGGSLANLTAIVTARDTHGIKGEMIPRSVVYITDHVHHCIDKALHIAGLGDCIHRTVLTDAHYRMDADALESAITADRTAGLNPWLVIASAGTTNSGAVDPLAAIGQIAAAHGLWYHVDGAYGALFALCPEGRSALRGIEQSDSVVMDPHKTLFLPYGTGAVLVRERQRLTAAFSAHADYLEPITEGDDELSPADVSPELTKHFRGLRLWLPLALVGVAPFRAALSEKIHLARRFHAQMSQLDGFEVGPAPDLSIVTYRYVPPHGDADAFNQRLMQAVQQEGHIFISSTRLDGKLVLRAAILCFRTHRDEIDVALDTLQRHARRLVDRG